MRQPLPFGKYVLLERISVGGMAEVFKAKSFGVEGFEKILAIKRILPSMAEDADFIEMFIDEAKICGQLSHANICQIFELGRVSDAHFIAMEFIWGKDLLQMQNRFRKQRQTMRPEMAAYIAWRMCEGLDYAHKKKDAAGSPLGVIHRDISPQNILVSYEGEVKIIDFGIAKAASRSSKTQAGVLKGKFGYMSPEQVRGLPLDRRSDVFAIGTILYEMLTADRLFIGDSDFETLEKVRNVDVPPPSQVNPQCPPELEAIILRALKREVEERYQWAGEMQEELQSFVMAHDPVFTAKSLSQWMREQFAAEMKREQDILDEQRKISRDALMRSAASDSKPLSQVRPSAQASSFDEDAATKLDDRHRGAERPGSASLLPEQTTQILDGQPIPNGARAAAGGLSMGTDLPSQSTAILDSDPGEGSATRRDSFRPVMVSPHAYTAPTPSSGVVLPPGNPNTGRVVAPLPYAPAGSTLWKDLLIGVAVAGALVGGVLGVRVLFGKGAAKGTLVVMVTPTSAAEVFVDGASFGHLQAGAPLTLKELSSGPHDVFVRGEGGEFRQRVQLQPNDVSVLSAPLRPATGSLPGDGTGTLSLTLADEGAHVYVDGAQLPDDAARAPIPLRAGIVHEIRVTKPQRAELNLSVSLRSGESISRRVALTPLPTLARVKKPEAAESGEPAARDGRVKPLAGAEGERRHAEKPVSLDPGFLIANTQPWAKVLIDGKDTGKTTPIAPHSKLPLKPGKHVVTFVVNGKRYPFDVAIKPGEDTRLIKQLSDSDL